MRKPLVLRVFSWLARGLGRERFFGLVRRCTALALGAGAPRRTVEGILLRVLRHGGRQAQPAEVERLIGELVWLYADIQTTLHLLDPGDKAGARERMELALLPELKRLRARGRGVILASPHFGNIVLAMAALGLSGVPLSVVLVSAEPYRWTEEFGLRVISLGAGAGDCLRALAAGEVVLTYGDLDFFPGGATAPFFGAPVRPPHGIARLSLASGAPILPVYAIHKGGGRYRLVADKAIEPAESAAQEEVEARLLRSMEAYIGRYPSHWFVLRDIWDLERCDRLNQRHLALLAVSRRLKRLLHA